VNNLPIRWGNDLRVADVRARVEAEQALRAARATLVHAVLALYAVHQSAAEGTPSARGFPLYIAWRAAERATMDAAAAYLAAGGSEETG